jgi:hypothetical protein
MKNAIFWDVMPCRSCVNRRFRGTYCLHLQGRKIRERGTSVSRWLAKSARGFYYLEDGGDKLLLFTRLGFTAAEKYTILKIRHLSSHFEAIKRTKQETF